MCVRENQSSFIDLKWQPLERAVILPSRRHSMPVIEIRACCGSDVAFLKETLARKLRCKSMLQFFFQAREVV